MAAKTFKYFAFGSNLLQERIRLNSPSAVFVCVAKLQDYKLAFARNRVIQERQEAKGPSKWGVGGIATIVESPGDHVWGTLWEVGEEHLPALDRQEGVDWNCYRPLTVSVCSPENEVFECRTYQMIDVVEFIATTPQYLSVILNGAKQNRLPEEYMVFLKTLKHNDYQGDSGIFDQVQAAMDNKVE
ncbi:gamma-glutamylcyclotransferase-like [Ptychodera flava]|uniref:gamma-glutamylcyclotransferase-like n=1 Tax=Ptychodera flava TaxID=63121 RepID=UPI00396A9BE0